MTFTLLEKLMKRALIFIILFSLFGHQVIAHQSMENQKKSEGQKTKKIKKSKMGVFRTFIPHKVDLHGWGMELGFGQHAYRDSVTRFSLLTPYLLKGDVDNGIRLNLQLENSNFLNTVEDYRFTTTSLLVEFNNPAYRNLLYNYFNLGISISNIDSTLYDQSLMSYPFSIGLNMILKEKPRVGSIFIEYRFTISSDYDKESSTPNLSVSEKVKGSAFDTEGLYFGYRFIF